MQDNIPNALEFRDGLIPGLRILIRDDFDAFYVVAAQRPNKHVPSPLYRPMPWPVEKGTAVWLDARDTDFGHVCSLVLRRIETGAGTLSDFFLSHFAPCFGAGELVRRQPILESARGTIVYQGDMWLAKEWQGDGIGLKLLEYGAALAWRLWQPTGIVGFFDRDPFQWPYARDSIYGRHGEIGTVGQNWGDWMEHHFWVGWIPASAIQRLPPA